MTANEFKNELRHLSGGYLFCGEEDYLKRYYLKSARKTIADEDDIFNIVKISADNYSPDFLMSSIESLPVMNDRKFIEISGLHFNEMKDEDIDEISEVLSKLPEYEYNVLIIYAEAENFDAGSVKRPSKLLQKLSKTVRPVLFSKETPARLASWVAKHFSSELIVAPPDAVNALLAKCGCDMSVLASEIEKLCWYLKSCGRERLTEADVEFVSSESKEIAAFDFANAILYGKVSKALSILTELRLKKERPEFILGSISKVVCDLCAVKTLMESGCSAQLISQKLKMHSYKVGLYMKSASLTDLENLKRIVSICYDADIRIKSTSLDCYTVLDRLTVEAAMR